MILLELILKAGLLGMMEKQLLQILGLDTAFHGNAPFKTNTVLEARSHGITFRTVQGGYDAQR